MSELAWIVAGGLAMSAIALSGAVTLVLPPRWLDRLLNPLVAVAAGSLFGGALFHLLPEAVEHIGNELPVYGSLAAGFVVFFLLEQFLHWHHSHRLVAAHEPLGYLILLADGLHNLLGGIAVAGTFLIDARLGIVTWFVAAAHEVPQELGDFGILVSRGWRKRQALTYNLLSGLTFLVGALVAYVASGGLDTDLLVPFAAGNFIYIASSDLLPELREPLGLREKLVLTGLFALSLLGLYGLASMEVA
ncbi:MAG: ZIP family metal transporter [Dehalococcoidia bacterium]